MKKQTLDQMIQQSKKQKKFIFDIIKGGNMSVIRLNESNFDTETSTGTTLVDFYADWCMPCKRLAPVLDSLAQVLEGKVTVAKINIDESPDVAKKFNVRSVPTLVVIRDGEVVNRQTGAGNEQQLLEFVNSSKGTI
jgi:thioredoxin 1